MINNKLLEETLDAIEMDFANMQNFEFLEAVGFVRGCVEELQTLIEILQKENKKLKLQLK